MALRDRDADHAGDVARPEARDAGGEDHQADAEQRAQRVEAVDEVDHDQRQERQMRGRAGAADGAQEHRIDAFDHQRAVDHRHHQQRHGGVEGDHQQRLVVHRQDVAEQHVQQVDIGALDGNDGDAERQRHQIEGRK